MYLKSLNVKGFKSFADKVTLCLEPGIMAIVGPNGSGKSNISDAILWVLGERNVRHLRGQAMEDVIFAGSSARKPSAVAEVELVLDNGDKTLAVDYAEVSIARRIYRSGESEYLLNGAIVRRRDIQDLLNDCGLGANAHSIISQGSLEEILSSSPAERQAMVEEAAGLLKHKQRRERATRKLETLSRHLIRVRDIAAMLKSQLRPLARKAERFKTYTELKERLDGMALTLAVDDLRGLQARSQDLEARERSLRALLESQKEALASSDESMEALSRRMRQRDDDNAERSRRARRFAAASESLGGVGLVLQERRRAVVARSATLNDAAADFAAKLEAAARLAQRARDDLKRLDLDWTGSTDALERLRRDRDGATKRLADLDAQAATCASRLKDEESALASARAKVSRLNETLNEARVRVAFLENQDGDLKEALADAVREAESLAAQVQVETAQLQTLIDEEETIGATLAQSVEARDRAKEALDAASADEAALESRYRIALDRRRAWLKDSGEARNWLESQIAKLGGNLAALGDVIEVDEGYETLVEAVLGDDGAAMLVDGARDVAPIAQGLAEARADGALRLVLRDDARIKRSAADGLGDILADHVRSTRGNEAAVEALFGDIAICPSLDEALAAHEAVDAALRFVTPTGAMVWPNGKVTLGAPSKDRERGPLALSRELKRGEELWSDAKAKRIQASETLAVAEESLRLEESRRREIGEKLAAMRGRVAAAQTQAESAQASLDKLRAQIGDLAQERADAEAAIAKASPAIEEAIAEEARHLAGIEELKAAADALAVKLDPLREEATALNGRLATEAASQAALTERRNHLREAAENAEISYAALVEERRRREEETSCAKRESQALEALAARFETLKALAVRDGQRLEDQDLSTREATQRLHDEWAAARDRASSLHEAYDSTLNSLGDLRVDKSRLEASVATIVASITEDLGANLDEAVKLEAPTDRSALERERDELEARVARLGAINPDAVAEYEELSERFAYVSEQLEDLEGAANALRSITEVIDRKMALDFDRTFEAVCENFQEIFTQLFPGGVCELRLLDVEEGEELPGIEVVAQPLGKRIKKMTLMSGGEKSLTALALLFAIYRVRRAPFYLLDEVEAALDDTNLRRLLAFLSRSAATTQLIMITHQRSTMEMADVLFGVTMGADGVTRVVSERLGKREG